MRGCVVGQPVASLGPAWAVLGSLCYKLPCLPGGTCAARLDTGAGVSAWGVLGGQLASGASQGSRRCAMSMLLCYAAALAASAARTTFMLSYQKEKKEICQCHKLASGKGAGARGNGLGKKIPLSLEG